jgi:hypothetical protein
MSTGIDWPVRSPPAYVLPKRTLRALKLVEEWRYAAAVRSLPT